MIKQLLEKRSVVIDPKLWRSMTASNSAAGIAVNPDTAINFSAYFAAIKILSESTAMLPLLMYRRLDENARERAHDHPLYPLLHDIANPEMDAYVFRETLTSHMVGWGNAYAEIESDNAGRIIALWPLNPSVTQPKRSIRGKLEYETILPQKFGSARVRLPAERVLHLRGLSSDGISGYSLAALSRQGIGLALAAEEYGARLFANNATPGGVLETPGKFKDLDKLKELRDQWDDLHRGLENSHRVAILEEGLTYKQIGIPPEDAQFLQTRAFQVEEIARWSRIPPHMLAMTDKAATYASVEAFGLQFITHTLMPWLLRWEKAVSAQLLLPAEREKYFAEHLMDAFLRGDTKSRYESYHIAWMDGIISADEWRARDNMNPQPNGIGKSYYVPLNMVAKGITTRAILTDEQTRELELWQGLALRKQKRGESLDFPFEVKSLPVEMAAQICVDLTKAVNLTDVKLVFSEYN